MNYLCNACAVDFPDIFPTAKHCCKYCSVTGTQSTFVAISFCSMYDMFYIAMTVTAQCNFFQGYHCDLVEQLYLICSRSSYNP